MSMIGKSLVHYEITSEIGRGGMGEVYQAKDTKLGRDVAIKVLPEEFALDKDRVTRFQREAKLLASLNHPNIAAIYGLEESEGTHFLVMELIEGETLKDRIKSGPIPVEEALNLALQRAEALETAHEKGVIHRDLKPANIKVTPDGKVKILDFGLAKALADESQIVEPSDSPTITDAMTRPGVVLGTAAYMSPEQAKGKSVDKRADIWAFGCILYECLTGKRAFEGETVTETLAAIIRGEPDWDALPVITSQNVRFVLRQCLEKDKNRRFRDAADVQILLDESLEFEGKDDIAIPSKRERAAWIWAVISILLVVILFVSSFLILRSEKAGNLMSFHLSVPPMPKFYYVTVSPDGRWIAFVASSSGAENVLYLCEVGSVKPTQLAGTEEAEYPFWSPDSRYIGFFAGGSLKKIDISHGSPQNICAVNGTFQVGGSWSSDGTILFSDYPVLRRVAADGGDPIDVASPEISKGEGAYTFPHFMPDGSHYLYTVWSPSNYRGNIFFGDLDSEEKVLVLTEASRPVYTKSGYLLFMRGKELFAQQFDRKSPGISGNQFRITDNIIVNDVGLADFGASENGVLVYRSSADMPLSQFVWMDQAGNRIGAAGEPDAYITQFDLSPDGKQIAVLKTDPATLNSDIWLLEWERKGKTRLTIDAAMENGIVWSHTDPGLASALIKMGVWISMKWPPVELSAKQRQ